MRPLSNFMNPYPTPHYLTNPFAEPHSQSFRLYNPTNTPRTLPTYDHLSLPTKKLKQAQESFPSQVASPKEGFKVFQGSPPNMKKSPSLVKQDDSQKENEMSWDAVDKLFEQGKSEDLAQKSAYMVNEHFKENGERLSHLQKQAQIQAIQSATMYQVYHSIQLNRQVYAALQAISNARLAQGLAQNCGALNLMTEATQVNPMMKVKFEEAPVLRDLNGRSVAEVKLEDHVKVEALRCKEEEENMERSRVQSAYQCLLAANNMELLRQQQQKYEEELAKRRWLAMIQASRGLETMPSEPNQSNEIDQMNEPVTGKNKQAVFRVIKKQRKVPKREVSEAQTSRKSSETSKEPSAFSSPQESSEEFVMNQDEESSEEWQSGKRRSRALQRSEQQRENLMVAPEPLDEEAKEKYFERLKEVLKCNGINEEKALRMLARKNLNPLDVVRTVKKNAKFYRNLLGKELVSEQE